MYTVVCSEKPHGSDDVIVRGGSRQLGQCLSNYVQRSFIGERRATIMSLIVSNVKTYSKVAPVFTMEMRPDQVALKEYRHLGYGSRRHTDLGDISRANSPRSSRSPQCRWSRQTLGACTCSTKARSIQFVLILLAA